MERNIWKELSLKPDTLTPLVAAPNTFGHISSSTKVILDTWAIKKLSLSADSTF